MRPSDLKSLRVLLEAIRTQLASALETGKQLGTSITSHQIKEQEANQKEWGKTQEILTRPRRNDPDEQTANEANQARRHWQNLILQGLLALGTWLAFAAAATYAFIAARELCTSQKQLEEMRAQNIILARPFIGIDSSKQEGKEQASIVVFGKTLLNGKNMKINLRYSLTNYGHSPAYVWVYGEFVDNADNKAIQDATGSICHIAWSAFQEQKKQWTWMILPGVPVSYDILYDGHSPEPFAEHMEPWDYSTARRTDGRVVPTNLVCILYKQANEPDSNAMPLHTIIAAEINEKITAHQIPTRDLIGVTPEPAIISSDDLWVTDIFTMGEAN